MIRLGCILLLASLASAPLLAAETPPAPPPAETSVADRVNELYDRLAKTSDEDEADGIVKALEREWLKSGSDASDLLMTRALEAFASDDYDTSLQLLDSIVATDPDWAEAWNKRATVKILRRRFERIGRRRGAGAEAQPAPCWGACRPRPHPRAGRSQ